MTEGAKDREDGGVRIEEDIRLNFNFYLRFNGNFDSFLGDTPLEAEWGSGDQDTVPGSLSPWDLQHSLARFPRSLDEACGLGVCCLIFLLLCATFPKVGLVAFRGRCRGGVSEHL